MPEVGLRPDPLMRTAATLDFVGTHASSPAKESVSSGAFCASRFETDEVDSDLRSMSFVFGGQTCGTAVFTLSIDSSVECVITDADLERFPWLWEPASCMARRSVGLFQKR